MTDDSQNHNNNNINQCNTECVHFGYYWYLITFLSLPCFADNILLAQAAGIQVSMGHSAQGESCDHMEV